MSMKLLICVGIASVLICIKRNAFAQIKPYIAVVNTGNGVFRGVLYQVTSDSVGVKTDSRVIFFSACDIKSIKLKGIAGRTRYKKYLSYDPYFEKNYEKVSHKMVAVRKWGEKDPTIEEELSCRILTGFYNAAMNGLAAPINMMSGSLATYTINHDQSNYTKDMPSLACHSILYQRNPETQLASQQQLKVASSN